MRNQISDILDCRATSKASDRKTVFNALLESDLPTQEVSLTRLQHEAITVIGAGFETTKYALTVASFHIINAPSIYQHLRHELDAAIPDPNDIPALSELEKLPYLTACIQECAFLIASPPI